ncbi:MAG: hypothetical protein A2X61_02845 [Ignavibacteria bacterium GWB2_35_12]|nr:MAG: hypothetical protein A2X61_02845 [Ignavibacteria bacterium GWB2_35_12]OGU95454.1 MAG: hypothetical protein A2220_07020 [Ignavibacteria bacterium RIFOXYA2_FULL_35_10]OGV20830.1 MAG: hypothetical protein A2475_11705 [Ignavibacteria bacterium RIFOXYC2_FULL_35_21]
MFFYAVQYLFIRAAWIDPTMVEHPIVPQIVVTVVMSGYGYWMLKRTSELMYRRWESNLVKLN